MCDSLNMNTALRYLSIIPNKSCMCTTYLGNKTAIITGGTSGIGYQTAKILASRGAKVIIADQKNLAEAKGNLATSTYNENVNIKYLDLSCLRSVRKFAEEINATESRLDILINNAGVGGLLHSYTKDLLQKEMQINHFGPFLLTHLLSDLLKKSSPSRIVFVSSTLAYMNNLSLKNLNTISDYPTLDFMVYSNSKLCNIIATRGFAERLNSYKVSCNAVHPGIAVTNIYQGMRGEHRLLELKKVIYYLLKKVAKTPLQAAQTVAHVAMNKQLEGVTGKFFLELEQFQPPRKAKDAGFCKRIWKKSEEFVQLQRDEKLVEETPCDEKGLLSDVT